MQRGASTVAVLRMTSWPVLIILILALLVALGGYWLRTDALTGQLAPSSVVAESGSLPSEGLGVESMLR